MGDRRAWPQHSARMRAPLSIDIPRARVREMQSVIASNAHRLVYGVGHFPDDALDTTLKALHVAINRRRILAP